MDNRDLFQIVLVEPEDSLNIGAVARAMMNLGFRHLHLVAPRHYERERALITARLAESLLDAMVIHDDLAEAVADCEEVVGLSLRRGKTAARQATLPEWSAGLAEGPPCRTALVFGPEDNGLRQEHLNLCRWIIRIPSEEAFTAFNLAQSTLLVLYEIARTLPTTAGSPEIGKAPLPTWNEFHQLDRLLDVVMTATGFVRPGSPAPIPAFLKSLFRRLEPNKDEMAVLLALFSRIDTTLRRTKEQ